MTWTATEKAAEAACDDVLRLATEAGMTSMMTANGDNIVDRIEQGFQGLLLYGSPEEAEDVILRGHEATGRSSMN
ncbi:MAG: hypothetical protein U5R14_02585 [Gemmatimonadota bacterium]|nr:hypothetical protein [Gemmatimonadota bacterium]